LQTRRAVNRLRSEHSEAGANQERWNDVPLEPVDPERHALAMRIEQAKGRLLEDLERASTAMRRAATRAGWGVGTAVVVSGILLAGLALTLLVRGTRRQIRVLWR
jgi:hypothetical protein